MKKFYIAALMAVFAACSNSETASTGEINPDLNGIFVGEGMGRNGEIVVSVTVTEGVVTDISLLQSDETPEYMDMVFNTITDGIIGSNMLIVDTVSGATLASDGLNAAISNALSPSNTSGTNANHSFARRYNIEPVTNTNASGNTMSTNPVAPPMKTTTSNASALSNKQVNLSNKQAELSNKQAELSNTQANSSTMPSDISNQQVMVSNQRANVSNKQTELSNAQSSMTNMSPAN